MATPAKFFVASSSKTCDVLVSFTHDALSINSGETNGNKVSYQLSEVTISPRLASLPREIGLPDGGKLVIDAVEPIDQHFNHHHQYHIIDWLEKNKSAWAIALVLVPICFYLLVYMVIPAGAKALTPLVPDSVKQQIDYQTMLMLDKSILDETELSSEQQQSITSIWQEMITLVANKESYSLNFRKSDFFGANAFALPGGNVVITDDLAKLLEDQPDALKAVIFHEMGHVVHQHGLQLIAESAGTMLITTYFLGDLEGIAEAFTGSAMTVIQNQFSQVLESEADDFAITQLKALGIAPSALGDALMLLTKDEEQFELLNKYLGSHPSVKLRIEKSQAATL